jgi:hypothetical protein
MKKYITLTESQMRNVIDESVRSILKNMFNAPKQEPKEAMLFSEIIYDDDAQELAEDNDCYTEIEGAEIWFNQNSHKGHYFQGTMPLDSRFVHYIDDEGTALYHTNDDGGFYFFAKAIEEEK